jgi:hypothetical protein
MRDPIILLTVAGLIGLVILNPAALTSTLGFLSGVISRTLNIAAGVGPAGTAGH